MLVRGDVVAADAAGDAVQSSANLSKDKTRQFFCGNKELTVHRLGVQFYNFTTKNVLL